MAATTSLSRIVLCNTAAACMNHTWWPLFQGVVAVARPVAGNPPPLSSELPASGRPHFAPHGFESGDGHLPTYFLRTISESRPPASEVAEEVGQPRYHRVRLDAGERGHVGVRHQDGAHPDAL